MSPMLWGIESQVVERFVQAGAAADNISFSKEKFTFNAPYPAIVFVNTFKTYYGPTMNAFEAAEKNGAAADLQRELEVLFESQNQHFDRNLTSISATFLKVTVQL